MWRKNVVDRYKGSLMGLEKLMVKYLTSQAWDDFSGEKNQLLMKLTGKFGAFLGFVLYFREEIK